MRFKRALALLPTLLAVLAAPAVWGQRPDANLVVPPKVTDPIERVTAWDTVTPMFRLEERYMPNAARVAAAARKVLEYQ